MITLDIMLVEAPTLAKVTGIPVDVFEEADAGNAALVTSYDRRDAADDDVNEDGNGDGDEFPVIPSSVPALSEYERLDAAKNVHLTYSYVFELSSSQ